MLPGNEVSERLDDRLVEGRVEESAAWEELLDDALELIVRSASLVADRSQSVLPLVAVFARSWQ